MKQVAIECIEIICSYSYFNSRSYSSPDNIDFMTSGWCYGRGGRNLRDDQWSISYTVADSTGNLSEKLYVLPDFISVMINRAYDQGYKEAQESIKKALGI